MAVSPGEPSQLARTESACPTFTWGKVAGAEGYELAVYRLRGEGVEEEPALQQAFPGPVDGWTPPLHLCLQRGGRYAWSVRALGLERASRWSPPRFFEVAAGPSPEELTAALLVIRRHLARSDETSIFEAVESEATRDEAPPAGRREIGPAVQPAAATETLMTVDGGVGASSFFGDASNLTGLDPTSFTSGVADIDILLNSASLDCSGCVDHSHVGPQQVWSIDIADGEVTGADIDANTVQRRVSGSCAPDGGIGKVGVDGSPTCSTLTNISSEAEEYEVQSLGGAGLKVIRVPKADRICFLTYVGMEDLTGSTEYGECQIRPHVDSQGNRFYSLEAFANGDADAQCGMQCLRISGNRTW